MDLVVYSFGTEGIDRHSVVYKKEFKPSDEELLALKQGDIYDRKLKELQQKMVNIYCYCCSFLTIVSFYSYKKSAPATRRNQKHQEWEIIILKVISKDMPAFLEIIYLKPKR